MTERGTLVFGAAIATPAFYLLLLILYKYVPRFPGYGPREIQSPDIWMAVWMGVGVLILATLITKLDPDLRRQELIPPDTPKPSGPSDLPA